MITNVDDLLGNPSNTPSGVFTNAEQIKGVPVDNTAIGEGKVLAYDSVNSKLIYKEVEGGSGVWGGITGTLSAQTDLQSALNGKADSSHTHTIANVTNLQTTLDSKVDEVVGKGLSTNDYSDTDEAKLLSLRTNEQVDILLGTKVDKIVGKGLSTNDLTNELKGQYDSVVLLSHSHTNKTLLDSLVSNGDGSKYLSDDGTYKTVIGGGGSGVDTFVELTDTPSTYVGQENKYVRVNPTATALEFIEGSGGGVASFSQLNDVPTSYVGQANKMVTVNDGESGLDFTDIPIIPTKTSDLTNDSNFIADSSYVHTDNNYTTIEKTKLSTIEENAEVNVQSDWNEVSNLSDSFIKNKPTIPTKTSDLTNDSNFVSDSSYVHTDNNYTTTEKTKLSNIQERAEVNVNADWNSTSGDSQILNKPNILSLATSIANPTKDYTVKNGILSEMPSSSGGFTPVSMFKPILPTEIALINLADNAGRTGTACGTFPNWSSAASHGVWITKLSPTVYDIQYSLRIDIVNTNINSTALYKISFDLDTGLGSTFTVANKTIVNNSSIQTYGIAQCSTGTFGGHCTVTNGRIYVTHYLYNTYPATKSTYNLGLGTLYENWYTGRIIINISGATSPIPIPTL
jgi:hypothetical protein